MDATRISTAAGTPQEVTTFRQTTFSYGRGLSGTAGIGYYLGTNAAIEFTISPGLAGPSLDGTFITDTSRFIEKSSATPPTMLQCSFMLHSNGEKTVLYSRAGLFTALNSKITAKLQGTVKSGAAVTETVDFIHRPAIGFNGAIGIRTEISHNVHLWAEASVVSYSPFLKKATIKEYSVNGSNILTRLPGHLASQSFCFSGTTTDGLQGTLRTDSDPFSSVGLNAGLTFDMDAHSTKGNKSKTRTAGPYVALALGYFAPLSAKTNGISGSYTITEPAVYGSTKEQFDLRPASYLSGISGRASIGYMFDDHIGVQCDAWLGLKTSNYKYSFEKYTDYTFSKVLDEKETYYRQATSPLLIIPSLVMQTGTGTLAGHIRGGIVIPARVTVTSKDASYSPITGSPTPYREATAQIATNFTIGYSFSAGASYSLGKGIRIFGETTMISYAPTAKSATLTGLTQFGQNILDQVPVDERTITYAQSGSHGPGSPTRNKVMASYTLPFSALGLMMGISVAL